jgi:hypothetical protein
MLPRQRAARSAFMLLVIGPVLLLTPIMAWHYRLANTKSARPVWSRVAAGRRVALSADND